MLKGQAAVSYLTLVKEFKTQLEKMSETIADSTYTVTVIIS